MHTRTLKMYMCLYDQISSKDLFRFQLQCFPIYSMLMAVGNPTVDYLSLDIEGAELAVS